MIAKAKQVIRIERDSLSQLLPRIGAEFKHACQLILKAKGRVVLTGMGKPGFIAQKISATLSSTGTPSLYVHPAEAIHGDMGRVTREDIVVALSNSGETEEILRLLPLIKKIGASLIAVTGAPRSTLARHADAVLNVRVNKEACPMNLAPTASTTAMLAMGDALAVALLEEKGFKADDFAFFHPGGNLGKRLFLKVSSLMRTGRSMAVVPAGMRVKDVLLRVTKARSGCAVVVDSKRRLIGLFTDGDLRRHLRSGENLLLQQVHKVMTRNPVTISPDKLAAEAYGLLRGKRIDEVPVVDAKRKPVGVLDVQDLLNAGVV